MGFSRSFNIYDLIFNAKNVFLGLNFANLYVKNTLKFKNTYVTKLVRCSLKKAK